MQLLNAVFIIFLFTNIVMGNGDNWGVCVMNICVFAFGIPAILIGICLLVGFIYFKRKSNEQAKIFGIIALVCSIVCVVVALVSWLSYARPEQNLLIFAPLIPLILLIVVSAVFVAFVNRRMKAEIPNQQEPIQNPQ